jgi:hypothetical protein
VFGLVVLAVRKCVYCLCHNRYTVLNIIHNTNPFFNKIFIYHKFRAVSGVI